jgi:hypothetical protein
MLRHILIATAILTLLAASASAQATRPAQPAPKPTAQPKPASPAPRREGQPINVRIELVITDQRGTAAPVKKNVSVIVGVDREGSIRSQSRMPPPGLMGGAGVQLNVDAAPTILSDGKIRLNLRVFYDLPVGEGRSGKSPTTFPPVDPNDVPPTQIQESVNLILENGKPLVVTQSADPMIDRQVTVEVKATILR